MEKLLNTIDELNAEYIKVWEDICNLESPSSDKTGVDAVGAYLLRIAREKGWKIDLCPQKKAGDAFCLTLNPDADAPAVVFSGHIDTVHPAGVFGTPAVRKDEEKIYGPGVMDCKGGVVASVMAMDALQRCGFEKRPVKVVVQSDEEVSSMLSDKQTIAFMVEQSKGAAAFLNTEGAQGNTVILERKGILRYRFIVTGKAMHSAKCTEGANAVAEAAHKLLKMEQMKDPAGLTCNCGVIQGGTVANSVAQTCVFTADIRFATNEQYEQAVQTAHRVAQGTTVPGCSCMLEEVSYRPAMQPAQFNRDLLDRMNEIYASCGLPMLTGRFCLSGADAAYTTEAGIPSVDGMGVDGGQIHSVNEFAKLDSLAQSAKRLAAVAYGL